MQAELNSLRSEVKVLRALVSDLQAEVTALKQAVLGPDSPSTSRQGETEFSLVGVSEPPRVVSSEGEFGPLDITSDSTGYPAAAGSAELAGSTRERICRQVGLYIAGALRDEISGSSGRERLPYRSRVWLVVRNFEGVAVEPPRLYHRWRSAQQIVERPSGFGRSIFVGLPTKREAGVVCESAQLSRPIDVSEQQ